MNTKQKIFCGVWVFAIIASAQAATTTSGITNKASRFSDVLSDMGATTTDSSNSELAETIRRQRALLDAQADKASAGGTSNITTANACDAALRKCMTEKCGADFTKCAKDSTTVWGNKMDACRRNTKCTGHEYTLLAPEILADRNAAIELSYYNSVVSCGNKYNNCIFGICGKTLDKCLSKSAGDSAIAKCKSIADECKEYDNGLAGRISGVFGDLRTVAAAGAQKDEKRLYELRDLMRTQCTRFGAMFDERTLDCVYTVNFFAGEDHTLMASKKLYSGDTFQCTPDWFGVDITTYMENAQRLTRSQKGASAAAMGAGLGTAAGLWTSGAVTRAIDTQKAEKQAKEACIADGGEWVSAGFNKGKTCDMTNAPQNCDKLGGKWDGKRCVKENNGQPISLSNGGGSNPGETPETGVDPNALTLTTENPQRIGKPCGNENAGTWISCNDAFCAEECYDNKKDQQVYCACVQTDCLKNGKLHNYYTILDYSGEPVPFANIECEGISALAVAPEDIGALASHATNFDGNFCLEENIINNAKCSITCIGLNPMVGTMKELKEALKKNGNKLIMCSGAIDLYETYKFGQSCETNSSKNTNTSQSGGSSNTPSECEDFCKSFTPSNDILAITPPKITYVKASSKCISSPACTTKIQNKCNELKDTEYNVINVKYKTAANVYYGCDYQLSQSPKDCSAICDKLVLTDLHLQRQQLSDMSCKNACTSIIQKACNDLVGETAIHDDGHYYRITKTNLIWKDNLYGCEWNGLSPGADKIASKVQPK